MSTPESGPANPEPITPELALQWVEHVPESEFDQPHNFLGGQVFLRDAVIKRGDDQNPSTPIVVVEHPDGRRETLSAADFLAGTGSTAADIRDQLEVALAPEHGAEVQKLAASALARQLLEKQQEEAIARRAQILFAPATSKPKVESPTDYANLFDVNYDMSTLSVEAAAVREDKRAQVTLESEATAIESLERAMAVDPTVREIIFQHPEIEGKQLTTKEIVDTLRLNPDLRVQLGSYFLRKINTSEIFSRMPSRIRSDQQKNTDYPGYESIGWMSSREYATLLALSMLDGTFKDDSHDPTTYNSKGEVATGQHRYAARVLLESR